MLVVEPPTARFDAGGFDTSHEDHLLERVSALENRLSRLTDKLEQSLTIMLKHARNTYFDHTLIQTLIGVLSEAGTIDAQAVQTLWRERCEREALEQEGNTRYEQLREEITAAYKGSEVVAFGRHVDVGVNFLGQDDVTSCLRSFERAAVLSPTNAPLLTFIGQHYFAAGKTTLAKDYLERAIVAAPAKEGVRLLLGLICGDAGEVERARELLSEAARRGQPSFAAHYGLGRLLVAEQKWQSALSEFKRALAARPSPEAHYVVGSVYYQMRRDRLAARHLNKAIELDGRYAEAYYLLGLVYLRAKDQVRAEDSFTVAHAFDQSEPRYRPATVRRLARTGEVPASPPLFPPALRTGKRVVTGGDQRLAQVLREDALEIARAVTL